MPCQRRVDRGFYILTATLFVVQAGMAQTVIDVDADATGANNGTSWTDAYTNLQAALTAAIAGNQIWVAAGAYRPAVPGGLRTASFQLKNGVALYGVDVKRLMEARIRQVTTLQPWLNLLDLPRAA